ncbi:DUF3291 domain-containing protein [Qingshengfaniella alkalisoli]|uniref:DUF3291 domain-containing protein n=1 Tax=Qingshengfaniella alkalisoli TaxID=2599296 RepID=A0A5B8IRD2_9RHOB|nr:DUF3291 domain-containing protein [Qingshengfaniella alkalisoli]QDY68752.1 DUF3291 domain-containing protein [Qingshengfaniella alkalisoli]
MRQPDGYHLAELNIARLVAPVDDPRVAEFMDALDRVNGIAERSPGFVWRLTGDGDNATDVPIAAEDPQLIPNLSVWSEVPAFEHFVWNTLHRKFYERRAEWFEVLDKMHFVMWWVPAGTVPSLSDAMERLTHLNTHGDSDYAFGWSHLKDAQLWRSHNCAQIAAE